MNNYFETNNKKECNGCGICALKCPQNAIKMTYDSEGFLYPVIDESKCINCGLCKKICSNSIKRKAELNKSYISFLKDNSLKKKSSSGGLFQAISTKVLNEKGIVFGVKYNEKMEVVHSDTTDINDLNQFYGSKYVRSNLNDSFPKVKKFLDLGKFVLFSGTPCQCNALSTFLGKEYENLLTCEIICHSNPSPKIFKMYLDNLEKKHSSKIININFRNKKYGWKKSKPEFVFENGKKVFDKSYFVAFGANLISRPSCNNCKFSGTERFSDLTIGDFWGIDKVDQTIKDDDSGISLLCINSKKGEKFIESIKDEIFIKEVDRKEAFKYNHNASGKPHIYRDKFFDKINNRKINEKNVIMYMKKYIFITRVINKLKKIKRR